MKIDNEFTVSVPIDQAWEVLTDLAGIAPCLPGAQLTGSEGDTYTGKIKIKVGPVTTEYAGTASFSEKDDTTYRAVIDAKGRDPRGAGNASATITASLRPDGERTVVSVDTDLKISGKIAQFGNSMIAEVSEKLLGQFVDCLEGKLATQLPAPVPEAPAAAATGAHAGAATAPTPPPVTQATPEPEALDLMELAGGAVAKRVVPLAIGVAVVAAVVIYLIVR
jgi:carbon monoxide dehydrogenase subunit G